MKVDDILMVIIGLLSLIIFYKIYKGSLIEGVESGDTAMCHTNQQCPGVTCPPGGTKEKPVLCPRVITDKKCNEQCDEQCAKQKETCPEIKQITIRELESGGKHEMITHIINNAENAPTWQMLRNFRNSGIVDRYSKIASRPVMHLGLSDVRTMVINMDTLVNEIFNSINSILLKKGYDDDTYLKLKADYIKHETEVYDETIKETINDYMETQKNHDGKYQGFKIKDD
jgi:hypothetical protein